MHLLRVQVPDFRGLKDIDITFEKDFFPSIFPLGSQNGGGKSTLLQLIFVLLHCSVDEDKKKYLQNFIQGFKISDTSGKRVLASLDIWDGKEVVKLDFYCRKLSLFLDDPDENIIAENLLHICYYSSVYYASRKSYNYQDIDTELLCDVKNKKPDIVNSFLNRISSKIFLAAPSTQVFLFLSQDTRKLLFQKSSNGSNYYGMLESARSKLPGLFTYDFLAVKLLIKSFKDARDRDFIEAIKTGSYGNSYQTLINDLNLVLGNKRINLNEDFSGVNFKLYNNGETIELYPEDLSHGELKRLSIYIWLKSRNIEDAIVLMDEVEIAFHPDWQYQIISDLKEWAPSNQYILATHSYALCEALTPAHVKEIEPKLIKQES